jgi:hypothetical protein
VFINDYPARRRDLVFAVRMNKKEGVKHDLVCAYPGTCYWRSSWSLHPKSYKALGVGLTILIAGIVLSLIIVYSGIMGG